MCSVPRAIEGVVTGGLSETVRGGMQVAKGDITGGLFNMASFGTAGSLAPKAPMTPAMPSLPADALSTALPGAPPPPAATAGGQVASPFNLSIRPRKSQSLRTDRGGNSGNNGTSGLNIPL